MSYYQGDFYPYQGDPGFFGSLGKLLKGGVRAALGAVPGLGTVVSAVGSIARSQAPGLSVTAPRQATFKTVQQLALPPAPMPGGAMTVAGPGVIRSLAPTSTAITPGTHGPCIRVSPRGRHIRINCRTGKAIRHMRVTNPKALRRAIRRANGFAHLARKVLHFTSPRAPKGRAIFKRRRKK